jgi:hypothetical protein
MPMPSCQRMKISNVNATFFMHKKVCWHAQRWFWSPEHPLFRLKARKLIQRSSPKARWLRCMQHIITLAHMQITSMRKQVYHYMVIKICQVQNCKIKKIHHICHITHASIKFRKKSFIFKTFLIYPCSQNKKPNKYMFQLLSLIGDHRRLIK